MNKVRRNKAAIIVFLLPAALLFLTIIIVPIFMSGYYSLLDWDGITKGTFVGFQNYIELVTSKSAGFPKTILNALLLAALSVFIQLPLSLMISLALARGIKGERVFTAVFFVPVLISTVVIGQLWLKMYNPQYGIVNSFLTMIGRKDWCRTWLGDKKTALISVFIPMLWQYVGYHMLLMYAGIKSISPDIREAACIDGAADGQISRYIIIPMIKPVIRMSVIFAVTGSLKAFDLIYVLTGGGPSHASEVPSTLMVSMIFGRGRYGLGSAIAEVIIFLCFFFAILIKHLIKTEEDL
ncbi:sugar ABC transporter permease [Anaerocolumna cellulosilytica]|uniref:Sugar ABC transporter permease n=1 Tax=Anaerocolumna cellulosilytica TaxID=433286 RepID=A0A6S6R3B2_9FIRM|nr:sugar ABC transporter permease [Anaerocolumna cellulosilytica]MBB5197196.1 raffinose/stachyose/melibiose transport system permease protein [Anaerocolumna cellulosilytica]BCJ94005.1 sugar ABC transporter permease [Anaerocolumna cellulosilytica]